MSKICAYCGSAKATTRDHVVPKELYRGIICDDNSQLITVPACDRCNQSFREAETKFCTYICLGKERTPQNDELYFEKGKRKRAHPANRKLTEELHNSFVRVDMFSEGGIFLGREICAKPPAGFNGALVKIARGLHYHRFGVVAPSTATVSDDFGPGTEISQLMVEYGQLFDIDERIFECKVIGTNEESRSTSIWAMRFYKSLSYLVSIPSFPIDS